MTRSQPSANFDGTRWQAVRLGLRLANSYLGPGAIHLFYAFWGVIGVLLCFVLFPMAIGGKLKAFEDALNPFALYGFVWPIGLMAAVTWVVQLFSRLLWCRLPKPLAGTFLAYVSAAGRLAVLVAIGFVWSADGSLKDGLLLPGTIVCAGIAGWGLVAEWGFFRILRRTFVLEPAPELSSNELSPTVEGSAEDADVAEPPKKSVLTRDVGAWFKEYFPRGHKVTVRIFIPLSLIAYMWIMTLNMGNPLRAFLDALLGYAVLAPIFFQIFWFPGEAVGRLISSISPKAAPEKRSSR